VPTDAEACDFPEARQLLRAQTKDLSDPEPAPVPGPGAATAPGVGEVLPARGPNIIRHFVASLDPSEADPKRLARAVRNHWGCETQHWRRDVLWREDKCLIRNPNAACALALLRVGLQALLVGVGRKSLPLVFEDVAADSALGLGWLKERNLRA
jgi:hypothetical protein